MALPENLLGGPPPTLLPDEPEARALLEAGEPPATVAARFPTHSAAWSALAEAAYADGEVIASYAYARTGYHRGLDALRRNGWKGHGPVPWEHAPNRGVLRCVHALGRAAADIGETHEADRCRELLRDSDPAALAALEG